MTLQQEGTGLLYKLPKNQLELIVNLMKSMVAPVESLQVEKTELQKQNAVSQTQETVSFNVASRFGAGIGIINDPKGFDDMNSDVIDYFEEVGVV